MGVKVIDLLELSFQTGISTETLMTILTEEQNTLKLVERLISYEIQKLENQRKSDQNDE
jgi:hypothetical protein